MHMRTLFLSRLLGWLTIVVSLSLLLRPSVSEIMASLLGNPALIVLAGIASLAAGLAIVLIHNVWRGDLRTIVVTIIGWAVLIRGVLMLTLPSQAMMDFVATIRLDAMLILYVALRTALGIFLVWPRAADRALAPA